METNETNETTTTTTTTNEANEIVSAKISSASAMAFLEALQYVLLACPREKDHPLLSYVVIEYDDNLKRLGLYSHDGTRWHSAFIETSEKPPFNVLTLTRECCKTLVKHLQHVVKIASQQARIKWEFGAFMWGLSFGGSQPLLFEVTEYRTGFKPESKEYLPPSYLKPTKDWAKTTEFEALHLAQSQQWKNAKTARSERDCAGRMHVVVTDLSGMELSRSVIVPIGKTDGLPTEPQKEIPNTISPDPTSADTPTLPKWVVMGQKPKQKSQVMVSCTEEEAREYYAKYAGSPGTKLRLIDHLGNERETRTVLKLVDVDAELQKSADKTNSEVSVKVNGVEKNKKKPSARAKRKKPSAKK